MKNRNFFPMIYDKEREKFQRTRAFDSIIFFFPSSRVNTSIKKYHNNYIQ